MEFEALQHRLLVLQHLLSDNSMDTRRYQLVVDSDGPGSVASTAGGRYFRLQFQASRRRWPLSQRVEWVSWSSETGRPTWWFPPARGRLCGYGAASTCASSTSGEDRSVIYSPSLLRIPASTCRRRIPARRLADYFRASASSSSPTVVGRS